MQNISDIAQDLARWSRDGQVQFTGQPDDQVKARDREGRQVRPALLPVPPPDDAVVSVAWSDVDAGALPERVAQTCTYAFDLANELPIRAAVFSNGPDEHVLLLLMHRIACDDWSKVPLGRDLTSAYAARSAGAAAAWGKLAV